MQEGEPEGVAPFPGRGREPAEDLLRESSGRVCEVFAFCAFSCRDDNLRAR